ncbi:MAG: DNA mismatch repair protein MutS, partial [Rhodobacteraceae bacterium]|nr:DNA mismatch repair protein MutS [Paracoccaceae bacterium]
YLSITQKGKLPLLRPPQVEFENRIMQIDAATRRNLELTHALSGGRAGSLLAALDRTVTSGGARLLELRVSSPSRHLDDIHARLDSVTFWHENGPVCEKLRDSLRKTPDIDRALSRLSLERGGPRDLAAIRNALGQAITITSLLKDQDTPDLIRRSGQSLIGFGALLNLLDQALIAEPPLLVRDGGFVAPGFDTELDEVHQLCNDGRGMIGGLQKTYGNLTGISVLKIKHNNVLGYFVETTVTHADKMLSSPLSETFIHRQTTANQVRFTTTELSDLETRILNAGNRAIEIEKRIYEELRAAILAQAGPVGAAARALSELDVSAALATLAHEERWTRPKVDHSRAFAITGGRHPVVEIALRDQGAGPFVANDCDLSADTGAAIWLLTGPNMAGKSTFLRQNALIVLLAQMGSFVPADAVHIGLVSQLFSRVGASDDLARGRSTFMVEMVETAAILNQADDRALVILDEIGRGTATYDGLSIAWATLEHLHEVNRTRGLFATHYHEMTSLAAKLSGIENVTVSVKEWEGEIVFLHEVYRGAADRSYGVQVAQLAGLPKSVIIRARAVLEQLEQGHHGARASVRAMIDDLPLFSVAAQEPEPTPVPISPVLALLDTVQPDDLTPKAALNLIYELKKAAKT